jgi:hypothetical protein
MMHKADRDLIESLKREKPFSGVHEGIGTGEEHKLKILGRGEMAFYEQGGRALLFELNAGPGVILRSSIQRWDDGQKVTDAEKELVVARIASYLKAKGSDEIIVK